MLEGKALVVAIMMLTAAPIAATDQGQAFLGDVTYEIGEVFNDDEEETKVIDKVIKESDIEDKELLLTDEKIEEDCLTLGQWKETIVPEEKIDEERDEKGGARGDKKESDGKKESDVAKEEWTDKKEVTDEEACLSAEEWALKFESDEDKEEPCFTIEQLEEKMKGERKQHKKGWDRLPHNEDKDWDREDKDWDVDEDEEFRHYMAELSEACDEGDEEACDELLEIREELAADRDEEDEEREDEGEEREEREEEEGSRSSDESENEEVREDEEKEFDEEACLTMEEWKEILDDDKEKDEREREDDRKEKGSHRDAFVREMIEELEISCEEEGNDEACEEFEAMMAHIEEIEDKEGGCDKERDEEEEESDEEEDWEDEDESEEDSDEENSEE